MNRNEKELSMRNIVFCAFGTDKLTNDEIAAMCRYLPESRIELSKRFYRDSDRKNCLAAFFLLLYALENEFGIKSIPETGVGRNGKPYFLSEPAIHFNISHSSGAVCCVISPDEAGIDIQEDISDYSGILEVSMSLTEIKTISESEESAPLCARYWSQKEAYLKYKSTGISDYMCTYDFSKYDCEHFRFRNCYITTKKIGSYSLSVCCESEGLEIIMDDIVSFLHNFLKNVPPGEPE